MLIGGQDMFQRGAGSRTQKPSETC